MPDSTATPLTPAAAHCSTAADTPLLAVTTTANTTEPSKSPPVLAGCLGRFPVLAGPCGVIEGFPGRNGGMHLSPKIQAARLCYPLADANPSSLAGAIWEHAICNSYGGRKPHYVYS
jgi:hypothetical protein